MNRRAWMAFTDWLRILPSARSLALCNKPKIGTHGILLTHGNIMQSLVLFFLSKCGPEREVGRLALHHKKHWTPWPQHVFHCDIYCRSVRTRHHRGSRRGTEISSGPKFQSWCDYYTYSDDCIIVLPHPSIMWCCQWIETSLVRSIITADGFFSVLTTGNVKKSTTCGKKKSKTLICTSCRDANTTSSFQSGLQSSSYSSRSCMLKGKRGWWRGEKMTLINPLLRPPTCLVQHGCGSVINTH